MKTAKEILDSDLGVFDMHEALEGLVHLKIKETITNLDELPDNYDHPLLTRPERNFMFITETERGFTGSGNITQYVESGILDAKYFLDPEMWSEVGMPETANVIPISAKIMNLNGILLRNKESMADGSFDDARNELNEIRRMVEGCACGDGVYMERLISYVRRNTDQFCSQDADGKFI